MNLLNDYQCILGLNNELVPLCNANQQSWLIWPFPSPCHAGEHGQFSTSRFPCTRKFRRGTWKLVGTSGTRSFAGLTAWSHRRRFAPILQAHRTAARSSTGISRPWTRPREPRSRPPRPRRMIPAVRCCSRPWTSGPSPSLSSPRWCSPPGSARATSADVSPHPRSRPSPPEGRTWWRAFLGRTLHRWWCKEVSVARCTVFFL